MLTFKKENVKTCSGFMSCECVSESAGVRVWGHRGARGLMWCESVFPTPTPQSSYHPKDGLIGKKVWKTLHTLWCLRCWTKKVVKINNTFENLKTAPLFRLDEMDVACRKCDRGARFWGGTTGRSYGISISTARTRSMQALFGENIQQSSACSCAWGQPKCHACNSNINYSQRGW